MGSRSTQAPITTISSGPCHCCLVFGRPLILRVLHNFCILYSHISLRNTVPTAMQCVYFPPYCIVATIWMFPEPAPTLCRGKVHPRRVCSKKDGSKAYPRMYTEYEEFGGYPFQEFDMMAFNTSVFREQEDSFRFGMTSVCVGGVRWHKAVGCCRQRS